MDISVVIIVLGVLILFSHLFTALFEKTRIPNVLLLLLIGLFVGPILHIVTPEQIGKAGNVFTSITLICILFESGIGLDLKTLGKSLGSAALITILNFFCTLAIGCFIGLAFLHLDLMYSLYLGAALGGTSSAVVIPMLKQLKPGTKANMVMLLESTLSDVLCLAVALSLISGLRSGHVSVGGVFQNMSSSIIFSLLLGVGTGAVWIVVLKVLLKAMKNSMFTSYAIAFILYGFCERVGWNGGLAILSFGIVVGSLGLSSRVRKVLQVDGDINLNQNERNFFSEIVFVLQTYFFVYIGICIQLNNIWHLILGLAFVAMSFGMRKLTTKSLGTEGLSKRDRNLIASLGPRGLIAAVLATLPLQTAINYAGECGLSEEKVTVLAEQKMTAEMPLGKIKAALGIGYNVIEEELVAPDTSREAAINMVYQGRCVRNVSYAVVLFSIIICSLLVIFSEAKKPQDEDEAEPATDAPQEPLMLEEAKQE